MIISFFGKWQTEPLCEVMLELLSCAGGRETKVENYCNFLIMFAFAPLSPILPPTLLGGRVYKNINAVAPGDVVKPQFRYGFTTTKSH